MLTRKMQLYFISACSLTSLQWSFYILMFHIICIVPGLFGSAGDLELLKMKACICIQKMIQTDFLQYKTATTYNKCTWLLSYMLQGGINPWKLLIHGQRFQEL